MSVLRKYTLKRNEGLEKGTIHLIIGIYEIFYLLFEPLFLEIVFPSPATNVPPSKKDNSNFYVKAETYI